MHGIFDRPRKVTKTGISMAAAGGNLAYEIGGNLAHRIQPNYIPPEIERQQHILSHFQGGFVVVNIMDPGRKAKELKEQAALAVHAMVVEGLTDEHTAIELRSILPGNALKDRGLHARSKAVMRLLRKALAREHGVWDSITNYHPITPSGQRDAPVDPVRVWGSIAPELDSFSHQMDGDAELNRDPQHHLAVLAITETSYAKRLFGDQIVTGAPPICPA